MSRRQSKRTTQIVAYTLSALVALSLIISLLGPVLSQMPGRATPTVPPTRTPWPTATWTPTGTPVNTATTELISTPEGTATTAATPDS